MFVALFVTLSVTLFVTLNLKSWIPLRGVYITTLLRKYRLCSVHTFSVLIKPALNVKWLWPVAVS